MRSILVGVRRWFGAALIVCLIGLFFLGVTTGPHPARIGLWYGWQALMPLVGILVLVATIVQMIRNRRVSRPSLLVTALLAVVSVGFVGLSSLPYLPSSLDRTGPAATVRLPMDGPVLVAWGGDRLEQNYHVSHADQRWAYDLVVQPAFVGTERLEDYGCFGVPVLAPAPGLVVQAHDGEPDQTPGEPTAPDPISGNAVALRLDATGTHLLIAHLRRGSVAVREGDRVAEGQPLGACGNSGNTSEPHVHIHHQREAPGTVPEGFEEGLPLYFRDHDGPPMPTGGFGPDDEPIGAVVRHQASARED